MKRAALAFLACTAVARVASAGDFDAEGRFSFDPEAVATLDFTKPPVRYVPPDADPSCVAPATTIVEADDALESDRHAHIRVLPRCSERFQVELPKKEGSYRASAWMRHGGVVATFVVVYREESGLDVAAAQMTPTGRTTSDGWVEIASNDMPVYGPELEAAYLKVTDYANVDGVDIDAFEVFSSGTFLPQATCDGLGDPVCGPEGVCVHSRCVLGPPQVPLLPRPEIRSLVVDSLENRLEIFFGGKYSRAVYLPRAKKKLAAMRSADTAWAFWNAWAQAIHELHDWHTDTFGGISNFNTPSRRLNACFFEGDADRSHGAWAKDARFSDILVSHAGPPETASGLKAGDRLVAIDGRHPLEWAASLGTSNWGYHVATDPEVYSDFAEQLGGPFWAGALMIKFARSFTVIRCDATLGTCSLVPETILVKDLANVGGGDDVACDNRPFYHLAENGPDPATHRVFGTFFRGPIVESTPEEKIFGMVWDTLSGNGDPEGPVNSAIFAAIADFKANARGVILDHRAGNGGTLDAATNVTTLVRPPETIAVVRMPMDTSGFAGPDDREQGKALFERFKKASPYDVGSDDHDPELPVALVLHRDGSASDYLPYGMKGAPKVRIFGPHQTQGAFSTFIDFQFWGGVGLRFASGDTITHDGRTLIGHGVQPDVVVLPKQSDLLAGKDTLFEAALAWVRKELKP